MSIKNLEKGFFSNKIGRIYYEFYRTGKSDMPTLVFIHGNTLDLRSWQPQVDYFQDKFNILTYDMRGFGKSDIPLLPYSRDKDLVDLMDYLGINKPIIVGVSLGALVALDVVNNYPKEFLGLILMDPVISGWNKNTESGRYWGRLIDVVKKDGLEKGKEFWLKIGMFDELRKNPEALGLVSRMLEVYNGWNWMYEDKRVHPKIMPTDNLSNITIPTLIIYGEKDLIEFKECSEWLHKFITTSEIVKVPGVGHLPNIEAPKLINSLIVKYNQLLTNNK